MTEEQAVCCSCVRVASRPFFLNRFSCRHFLLAPALAAFYSSVRLNFYGACWSRVHVWRPLAFQVLHVCLVAGHFLHLCRLSHPVALLKIFCRKALPIVGECLPHAHLADTMSSQQCSIFHHQKPWLQCFVIKCLVMPHLGKIRVLRSSATKQVSTGHFKLHPYPDLNSAQWVTIYSALSLHIWRYFFSSLHL